MRRSEGFFKHNIDPLPSTLTATNLHPMYMYMKSIAKHLPQGHKCHDRDSNPRPPELEFEALNHSAITP